MTIGADGLTVASFADVSGIAPVGTGSYEALVDERWTIAGKPNGGYLLAMLGRAAIAEGAHAHPIAASATYVSSPDPGPVTIQTEVLRAGRSASQVRTRLLQGDRTCVEAVITTATLGPTEPFWSQGLPAAGGVPWEECVRLVPTTESGVSVSIMEHVEVRLEPDSYERAVVRPAGRGELRGWLGLPRGEPFDPVSLLYAVDGYPPATFDIERAGWVPTLELSVYVRALPAPGPVRVLQRAQLVDAQRVDEACFVWDRTGRLVAQGTQLALIRLG